MKRIVLWLAATVTILVLMFAYHTSTNRQAAGTTISGTPSAGGSSGTGSAAGGSDSPTPSPSSPSSAASPQSGSTSSTPSAKAATPRRYTGGVVQTSRGPVQVRITVTAGKITDIAVPVRPDEDPRSQQINDYAVPQLVQETLSAQSTQIDMISGATITSEGYQQSLQSALDQAGLG